MMYCAKTSEKIVRKVKRNIVNEDGLFCIKALTAGAIQFTVSELYKRNHFTMCIFQHLRDLRELRGCMMSSGVRIAGST